MAIVKGPCHSELASGNMGSVCYSRWRGRAIARDVWSGTVPNTSGQVEVQSYLTEAVNKWRNVLTLEQAEAWRSFAEEHPVVDRLGDIRASTGFNRFVSLWVRARCFGQTGVLDPPGSTIVSTPTYMELKWWTYRFGVRLRDWMTSENTDLVDYWIAGPYDSVNRRALDQEYRQWLTTSAMGTRYWVPPTEDKWYWFRGRWAMNDGRAGNWLTGQAFAEAA